MTHSPRIFPNFSKQKITFKAKGIQGSNIDISKIILSNTPTFEKKRP